MVAKMSLRNSEEALLFDPKILSSDAGPQARFSAGWEMIREASLFQRRKRSRPINILIKQSCLLLLTNAGPRQIVEYLIVGAQRW